MRAPLRRAATLAFGLAAVVALVLLAATSTVLSWSGARVAIVTGANGQVPPSPRALGEIPREYLILYKSAASRYGLDWAVLAGIGRVECDHGKDPDPSCTREGFVNAAGAGGPMQFLASSWVSYGVDGGGDGYADRWNAADAIYSAANYLRRSGAPADYVRAIYSYNHAGWYVAEVMAWAKQYRGIESAPEVSGVPELGFASPTPVQFVEGSGARLSTRDGHVALIPVAAPRVIQAMIVAGNELQDLPYGPSGHPDPRGAYEEDCSSATNYVLYRAGVRPIAEILRDNPLAQDYVRWGVPGPGRWVTIYSTDLPTPHVFMVIAGLRLDTSHGGSDVGPNRFQDGPRWRLFGGIPTWAHWAVRHPPGL